MRDGAEFLGNKPRFGVGRSYEHFGGTLKPTPARLRARRCHPRVYVFVRCPCVINLVSRGKAHLMLHCAICFLRAVRFQSDFIVLSHL